MRLTSLVPILLPALLLQACCCPPRVRRCPPPRCCAVRQPAPTPAASPKHFVAPGRTDTWTFLAGKYDVDADARITKEEYGRDEAAFARLDVDDDGAITEKDFAETNRMNTMVAQMTIMRYFHADEIPLLLARAELETSFARLDTSGSGKLSRHELDKAVAAFDETGESPIPKMVGGMDLFGAMVDAMDADADALISLAELHVFFDKRDPDGDGAWKMSGRRGRGQRRPGGVAVGEPAPDFTLAPPGGGTAVTLSSFRGRKPVALIFGSYT